MYASHSLMRSRRGPCKRDGSIYAPLIPHEIDYDFVERKGNKHVSEQAQRGGDDRGLETGRRRASRRGCGAGSGRVKAHDLRVEGEVRGDGCEPGAGSEAVAPQT